MRTASTLMIVVVLSQWAGAQVAPTATAERLRLLRQNARLVEQLFGHTVKVSDAPDQISRVGECRKAMATLGDALAEAASDRDTEPDCVAELAEQVAHLLETGLTPTLLESRAAVERGSPGAERLAEVERGLSDELTRYRRTIAPESRLGDRPTIRTARHRLDRAHDALTAKPGQ